MNDDPKHTTTMSSGISNGDLLCLPSQASLLDSPHAPEASDNATNFSAKSPTGGLNDQNEATGTLPTKDSKVESDHPRPSQPSDEISMELVDFDQLKAEVEQQRELSVQTFHGKTSRPRISCCSFLIDHQDY